MLRHKVHNDTRIHGFFMNEEHIKEGGVLLLLETDDNQIAI